MPVAKKFGPRQKFIIQFFLIVAGFSSLLKVSSEYLDGMVYLEDFSNYYVSYLLCYGLGMCALTYNSIKGIKKIEERRDRLTIYVFSLLFALMITGANYALWFLPSPEYAGYIFRNMHRLLYTGLIFAGCGCAFYNLFVCLHELYFLWEADNRDVRPVRIFLLAFLAIAVIDLLVLLTCKYPGNLQTDSFAQIYQATGDMEYSNHHPFYHTLVIKLFMDIGLAVFGNYSSAVAVYICFQIVFMAICFAYAVMLMAELKAPRWLIVVMTIIYSAAPHHIMYSFSMTKDVMFGGFVLLAVVSVFRLVKDLGNRHFNMMLSALSGLGVCLFRSNGLFVYLLWMLSILFIYRKEIKRKPLTVTGKMLICMCAVVLMSLVLKYPVLKAIGVHQTDFVESLSIPIQQIARTAVDNNDLTEEQTGLLSKVLDIDKIREFYYHTSSDPLKEHIRAEGDEEYLVSHKADFLKLYIAMGLKHPSSYASAWVDQTYGYWNAGYKDWHWYDWVESGIYDNRYDIHRAVRSEKLNNIFNEYLWLFEEVPILQLFLCMGLHMWIVFVMLYVAIIRKDKEGIIILLPIIWILVSFMIATPLSMEFRYAYAVFCVLPAVVPLVLRKHV